MESKISLPKAFKESMKELLKDEYDEFEKTYDEDKNVGLRHNPLKASREHFLCTVPFSLEPVSFAKEGFYYDLNERPGKHFLHEAGAYYIQEPSAMSAVEILDPCPGDKILDLCAAPGGKSTQIAGRLMGSGLLVSNEIVRERAKILSSNIERMGVSNALVISESPDALPAHFPSFFDKILVDAPCSGEGMFKKEEHALSEWSPENVMMCHNRQLMILNEASKMLKSGGVLTYSTCTFNSIENEGTVSDFLSSHPEFALEKTERFWPHLVRGEGHFVARFKKAGEAFDHKEVTLDRSSNNLKKEIAAFLTDEIGISKDCVDSLLTNRKIETFGENIYLLPEGISSLKGLKVERPGLHLAMSKKNRFEPAHALALSLDMKDVGRFIEISDAEAEKYISGETLPCDPDLRGWVLVTARGFSLGFGKASSGMIKNHYPKGLRR